MTTAKIDSDDELLSKELLRLSVEDRNGIQEEIHGVRCLAPEETPHLIYTSLCQLAFELDNDECIPPSQKRAYLKSQQLQQQQQQQQQQTYVNGVEFRLRFLRCELFDAKKAAKKMVSFLNYALDFFGEYALMRPIQISDFTRAELKIMRTKGKFQFLPFRDRSGRRIFFCFPGMLSSNDNENDTTSNCNSNSNGNSNCNSNSNGNSESSADELDANSLRQRNKILLYLLHVAGDDIETQRKGIVVLIWFGSPTSSSSSSSSSSTNNGNTAASGLNMEKFKKVILNNISNKNTVTAPQLIVSVRVSCIHICSPDTPAFRLGRSIMLMTYGNVMRTRMKMHVGELVELRYILSGFGIPTDTLPLTWTGRIKLTYGKQWIRLRQFIEEPALQNNDRYSIHSDTSTMIECPSLNDVVFRQGTSSMSHPGNAMLRGLVESKWKELENRSKNNNCNVKSKKKLTSDATVKTRALVFEIIEEVITHNNGRFLIWNDKMGAWSQLNNMEQIYLKMEYIVRDFRKFTRQTQKQQQADEKPSHAESSQKQQRPIGQNNRHHQQISLQSSTSIFQFQGGTAATTNAVSRSKRQRLLNDGGYSDNETTVPSNCTGCFGIPFTAQA